MVACEEIRKQVAAVHATCRPIMNTPKPKPKPVEPAKEEAKTGDSEAADAGAAPEASAVCARILFIRQVEP